MKRLLVWCFFLFCPLAGVASDHDFNAAVASIEQTYHVHRQHLPMAGMVGFCAHFATGGAVKGLQIAEFDEGSELPEGSDMPALLKETLGRGWSLMVDTRSNGEQDAIYAHPEGHRMVLLVASYDHGELSVVRMNLDAKEFSRWIGDPVSHARHRETN